MNNGKIELRLKDTDQLLLDPGSPFSGKRFLTPESEEFITEEAKEFSRNTALEIILQLQSSTANEEEIINAIHRHFEYRKKGAQKKLVDALQLGWKSLVIAIILLAVLVVLILVILAKFPEGGLSVTIRELLIILGWVALWRPVDILLYEWRPFKSEMKLYDRLARSKVSFRVP